MSSALVMASGPSLPEPVTAVTEPVVVMSPSSHAMAGHLAVGDGVGTSVGGRRPGRGRAVGTPDGATVGWDVGVDVGTVGHARGVPSATSAGRRHVGRRGEPAGGRHGVGQRGEK